MERSGNHCLQTWARPHWMHRKNRLKTYSSVETFVPSPQVGAVERCEWKSTLCQKSQQTRCRWRNRQRSCRPVVDIHSRHCQSCWNGSLNTQRRIKNRWRSCRLYPPQMPVRRSNQSTKARLRSVRPDQESPEMRKIYSRRSSWLQNVRILASCAVYMTVN